MGKIYRLNLQKFDITSIQHDKTIILVGKRDTGKSFLVRDLLYYQRDIPLGNVISPTECANKFYSSIVPSIFIYDKYTPETVEKFVKRQKLVKKRLEKQIHYYGSSDIDDRAFFIMDDCLYDSKTWVRDPNINFLFLNGRHYHVLFLVTMQYPLGIPPVLRSNIDYVFILRENNLGNRKRLYENFAGMLPSFEMFCSLMDQCTENYECLVIHCSARSNKLTDQIFWYKAEPHGNFKMGSPYYWAMDEQYKQIRGDSDDDDDADEEELVDVSKLKRKKNAIPISVNKLC